MIPIYNLRATLHGTLYSYTKDYIIEMSLNDGVYILNKSFDTTVAISSCGNIIAVDHPVGKVFYHYDKVDVLVHNENGNRIAKIWNKGISFTTNDRLITFLLDEGGVKSTIDWFLVMDNDLTSKAFYYKCDYGQSKVNQVISLMHQSQHWISGMGAENWKIGNIKISQITDGTIRVYKNLNNIMISCNPYKKSIFIKTPTFHCTASMNSKGHLFIRYGDRRIHYDGVLFNIRNAGQSAVIDVNNKLSFV